MDTEESENDDYDESGTNVNRTSQSSFSLYNALDGWSIEDIVINTSQLVANPVCNYNLQQQTRDNVARKEDNGPSTHSKNSSNPTIFEVPDDDNKNVQQSQNIFRENAVKHHTSAPAISEQPPVAPSVTCSDGPRSSNRRRRKPRDAYLDYRRLRRRDRAARLARAARTAPNARPSRIARVARTARSVRTVRTVRAAHNIGHRASCPLVPGRTPLHLAIQMDAVELVEMLVGAGADVNVLDERGRSPLQLATSHQNMQIVRALLGSGARGARAKKSRTKDVAVAASAI